MPLRSRTGCAACKSRHQKCDEAHPECRRCVRLGLQCHYPHLEDLNARTVNRPLRPAPSRPIGDSAKLSSYQSTPTGSSTDSPRSSESCPTPAISLDRFIGFSTGAPPEPQALPNPSFVPQGYSSPPFDFSLPTDGTWHTALEPPTSTQPWSLDNAQGVLAKKHSPGHGYSDKPNSPQTIQFDQQAFVLEPNGPTTNEQYSSLTWPTHHTPTLSTTPMTTNPRPPALMPSYGDEDEDDPEGVGRVMCNVPKLDSNAESNTLAFVLQSYAQWFTLTVFDPLRVAHQAKTNVVTQFNASVNDRRRVILVANAFNALGRTLDLNSNSLSLISFLTVGTHAGIAEFNATQPSFVRELDIREALRTLENMIEIILIHFFSSPLSTVFELLQNAAPVFRRACSEPVGQLPNLPNILLEPEIHRRFFAVIDVSLSVTTARPMLFRYDVTYPLNFSNQGLPFEYGLEWMHGIPDRFIVLFASINALMEDSLAKGVAVDPDRVAEIEDQVKRIVDVRDFPQSDPVLRVGRVVVRECWRQAVLIYLHMALCGAHAKDPRVERPFKKAMRLIDNTRPGRNPDSFMFIPMIVIGVAACNQVDRDTLNRRMLATRECSVDRISGNNCVQALNDLWTRTDGYGRPAIWPDYKASIRRVVGM